MGTPWRGMLAPLSMSTGDGRRFAADGITHRALPLALKWQRGDTMGHDDAVVVGSIDQVNIGTVTKALNAGWIGEDAAAVLGLPRTAAAVWGAGVLFDDVDPASMPRLAEDVAEVRHLTEQGVIGPSVDAGAAQAVLVEIGSDEPISEERLDELFVQAWENGEEPALEVLFVAYEIAAATLVQIPAFGQVRPLELVSEAVPALTAAVRSQGWSDMPLAGRDRSWDGDAAAQAMAGHCGIDGDDPDWSCYAAGFLYVDGDADPETVGAYGFGIADVIDGAPTIVPAAVFAVAAALQGARGGTTIPDDDQERMRTVVEGIYSRMADEFDDPDLVPPWDTDEETSASLVASLVAAAGPAAPADWFDDPGLGAVTPLSVGEDGRVFGHIAAFGTCHVGIRDACVTAPTSPSGYGHFHRYAVTDTGRELPVPAGRITVAHGTLAGACACCPGIDDHACNRLSLGAAIGHYDRARTVAYVRAGEDAHGIWVAGVLADGVDDDDRAALARQRVSGDWRDAGGALELVEVLTLARERPGFPLPRTTLTHGRQVALVAAGAVRPAPRARATGLRIDYPRLGREVAAALTALNHPATAAVTAADPPADPPAGTAAAGPAAEAAGLLGEVADVIAADRQRITAGLISQVREVTHV